MDPARRPGNTAGCAAPGLEPELTEDAGQVGLIGRAELAEQPFCLGAAGRPDRGQHALAALGQLDQGGPPVAGSGCRSTRPRDSRASVTSVAERGAMRS